MRILTSLAILCLSASAGLAASPDPLPMTYDVFEVSVPHMDLSDCPTAMQAEDVFCRATMANDEIHVFAFSQEGDSPLVGFASFEADALGQLLN